MRSRVVLALTAVVAMIAIWLAWTPSEQPTESAGAVDAPAVHASAPRADVALDTPAEVELSRAPVELADGGASVESAPSDAHAAIDAYRAKRLEELQRVHAEFVQAATVKGSIEVHSAYSVMLTSIIVDMDARGDYRETDGRETHFGPFREGTLTFLSGKRRYVADLERYPVFGEMQTLVQRLAAPGSLEEKMRTADDVELSESQRKSIQDLYTSALEQLTAPR